MNKKQIFSAILLFTLTLGASGCGFFEDKQTEADQILDTSIYEAAIATNDPERCNDIANEVRNEECKQVVESLKFSTQALNQLDTSICSLIKLERYKDNCVKNVEKQADLNAQKLANDEAIKKQSFEISKLRNEAFEKKDSNICNKIAQTKAKNACIYNVVANQALDAGDQNLCDSMTDQSSISKCKALFKKDLEEL